MAEALRDLAAGRERLGLQQLEQLEQARGGGEHGFKLSRHRGRESPSIAGSVAPRGRRTGGSACTTWSTRYAPERSSTSSSAAGRSATGGCSAGSAARTSGRSSRRSAVARPLFGGLANEDEFHTEHDGGMTGMSFRFFDPATRAVVDLLGRQPPPRRARSAGVRNVPRRHRGLRGRPMRSTAGRSWCASRGRARRRAAPRWEQAFSADGGATLGDQLDHGLHARGGRGDERARARPGRSAADYRHVAKIDPPGARSSRPAARCSSGTTSPRANGPIAARRRALAREGLEARRRGRRARGRARVRHPAPLRRELLLPPDLDLAQPERALGDGLGEGRRRRARLRAVAGRGAAPSDVLRLGAARGVPRAGARGAATCARRAMRAPARTTSGTPTRAPPEAAVSVSAEQLRRIALALPGASEEDHHGKPSFRVGGRIFAMSGRRHRLRDALRGRDPERRARAAGGLQRAPVGQASERRRGRSLPASRRRSSTELLADAGRPCGPAPAT